MNGRRLPAPTEGQPIPAGQVVWISRPDQAIRQVWTSPTEWHLEFDDPQDKVRLERIEKKMDRLFAGFPDRTGNATLATRFNQASRWYPRLALWLLLGAIALVLRRPRDWGILVTLTLAAMLVVVFNALGLFADPHFVLPVAPAFVLFGRDVSWEPGPPHLRLSASPMEPVADAHVSRVAEMSRFTLRRATCWARLEPSFLVIGAQRCGTTSLNDYLAEHPGILCATVKEVKYFHRYYEKGACWYRARFPLVTARNVERRRTGVTPVVGETTPDYLFDPRAPARVHAFDPRMKLIAILRDPVERAHSHRRVERRRGTEPLSFEDALDREESELVGELERLLATSGYVDAPFSTSYVARGRYAEQLERWLELFPREQLLVLLTKNLADDPRRSMARVAATSSVSRSGKRRGTGHEARKGKRR